MKTNHQPEAITVLEMEVLKLMAQDKTTEEIANLVHVSPQAVKMRIFHLKQKHGIRTHAALLVKLCKTFIL